MHTYQADSVKQQSLFIINVHPKTLGYSTMKILRKILELYSGFRQFDELYIFLQLPNKLRDKFNKRDIIVQNYNLEPIWRVRQPSMKSIKHNKKTHVENQYLRLLNKLLTAVLCLHFCPKLVCSVACA